jgi:hypothetical protein
MLSAAEALSVRAREAVDSEFTLGASVVLTAQAEALLEATDYTQAVSAALLLISIALLWPAVRDIRRWTPGIAAVPSEEFRQHLDVLIESLAGIEARYASASDALRTAQEEREQNEALVLLTKQQAEAVRREISTAATKGSRVQVRLAVAGVVVGVLGLAVSIVLTLF